MYVAVLKLIRVAWPYLLAGSLGFGAAYYWQGLRWDAEVSELNQDWAEERQALADAANEELQRQIELRNGMAEQIRIIDRQRTEEIRDAERKIESLVDDVRRGKRRLFIEADCPSGDSVSGDSASASLGDGKDRAQLDRDAAERLIRLTERGDQAIRQLGACQDYVETILQAQ